MSEKPVVLMGRAPAYGIERLICQTRPGERGAAYILALVAMLTGLTLALALLRSSNGSFLAESSRIKQDSAKYLAEAGVDYAAWQVEKNNVLLPYADDVTLGTGSVHVTAEDDGAREGGTVLITATANGSGSTFVSRRVIEGPQLEIIIDNPQGSGSANWATGTMSPDKYGSDYRFRPTAAVSDVYTWTPTIYVAGNYEVFAWWSVGSNRAPNASYIVRYQGGNQSVPVNQSINGGKWNSLGTFAFAAGTGGNVKLSCWTTSGKVVVADAVRFVRR